MDQSKQFDDLARYATLTRAPEIKFRDLLPHVGTVVRFNILPFDVRADFVRLTSDTVLVPVTVQLKSRELVWTGKEGVQRMTVYILGRVSTMTGKVVQTFEDTVTDMVAADLLPKITDNSHVYWKALPLSPGRYRLDLVIKDVNSDRLVRRGCTSLRRGQACDFIAHPRRRNGKGFGQFAQHRKLCNWRHQGAPAP